jgi:hypothetical protein
MSRSHTTPIRAFLDSMEIYEAYPSNGTGLISNKNLSRPKLEKQVKFPEAIQVLRHHIWVFGLCIMYEPNMGVSRGLSMTLTLYYVPPPPHEGLCFDYCEFSWGFLLQRWYPFAGLLTVH